MAKSPPKTTVSVTAGTNAPVKHVIKFEDLVQHLKKGAAKPAGARAVVRAAQREQLVAVQKLAADLEKRLRSIRAETKDKPAPSAARGARSRKQKS
jgi:phage gp29-like protein